MFRPQGGQSETEYVLCYQNPDPNANAEEREQCLTTQPEEPSQRLLRESSEAAAGAVQRVQGAQQAAQQLTQGVDVLVNHIENLERDIDELETELQHARVGSEQAAANFQARHSEEQRQRQRAQALQRRNKKSSSNCSIKSRRIWNKRSTSKAHSSTPNASPAPSSNNSWISPSPSCYQSRQPSSNRHYHSCRKQNSSERSRQKLQPFAPSLPSLLSPPPRLVPFLSPTLLSLLSTLYLSYLIPQGRAVHREQCKR